MNPWHILSLTYLWMVLAHVNMSQAQSGLVNLSPQDKQIIVDSITNKLLTTYVFPELAAEMAEVIQANMDKGAYESIHTPFDFANRLADDLIAVSQDKHIRVEYHPQTQAAQPQGSTAEERETHHNRRIARLTRENFGFKELKILEGNIGYLDLRSFADVEYGGPTAVSAMNFLSSSDAIIIDLRNNTGGSPAMIQLLSSYLFPSPPIHLNTFYWRPSDRYTQTWTLPHVQGKRSPETPVYILTSKRTFSAAEEFSYNLKHLQRATLIGETTGGGAHPTGAVPATDQFTIWVPSGRAINPVTNTNWEGTGVSPHVEVAADQALGIAHVQALEYLIEKNDASELDSYYQWHLSSLKSKIEPVMIDAATLNSYVGTYGPRVISLQKNTLYYQRGEDRMYELIPVSQDEFELQGFPSFRVRFVSEKNKVTALEMYSDSGYSDQNTRMEE
ncbi:MAG: S41 family peptidase [Bacteroidota bacterium]